MSYREYREADGVRLPWICGMRDGGTGCGWFRIWGWGLHWKNTRVRALTFSERNGYLHGVNLGRWRVRSLRGWNER